MYLELERKRLWAEAPGAHAIITERELQARNVPVRALRRLIEIALRDRRLRVREWGIGIRIEGPQGATAHEFFELINEMEDIKKWLSSSRSSSGS